MGTIPPNEENAIIWLLTSSLYSGYETQMDGYILVMENVLVLVQLIPGGWWLNRWHTVSGIIEWLLSQGIRLLGAIRMASDDMTLHSTTRTCSRHWSMCWNLWGDVTGCNITAKWKRCIGEGVGQGPGSPTPCPTCRPSSTSRCSPGGKR